MKYCLFLAVITAVIIIVSPATTLTQEKQKSMKFDQKQMLVMELMRDSSSVNMLMDRLASDSSMRTKLMDKIINRVQHDSSAVIQIGKMIKGNKEIHSIMMKMMQ